MLYNIYGTSYTPIVYSTGGAPSVVLAITDSRNIQPEGLFKGQQMPTGGVLNAGNNVRDIK